MKISPLVGEIFFLQGVSRTLCFNDASIISEKAFMFQKKKEQKPNLFDMFPVVIPEYEVDDEQLVSVKIPRFNNELLRKYLTPRGKNPFLLTKLDSFGSFVLLRCDGDHTVLEIAEGLLEEFGDEINPVHNRLALFIRQLQKVKYVRLLDTDKTPLK